VFLGSGPFAVPLVDRLAQLCASGTAQELALVVTRPDRRAGRGRKTRATPVSERCEELQLPFQAPESANDSSELDVLAGLAPDLILVADYGEFLGKTLRQLPRIGTYNFHGSLLPRHRGAAPVAHALLAGDSETGVTLFRLVRAMDAGPMVDRAAINILPDETAGELEDRLALLAADLLEKNLPAFAAQTFHEIEQDESAATVAPKLTKDMGVIAWQLTAQKVHDHIRAMNPWPGALAVFTPEGSEPSTPEPEAPPPATPDRLDFRVFKSRQVPHGAVSGDWEPGQVSAVTESGFTVRCADGDLELLELQRPGKARMPAQAFLRGFAVHPGDRFESTSGV
jgi:methionyl-tRNA formyltransferase